MCPRGHTLCTYFELGTALGRARGQRAGRRGEAKPFLPVARSHCKEEGLQKDFLEDGWKNGHGKGKEGLPGRGGNVQTQRQSNAVPLRPRTIQFNRVPRTA